MRVLIVSLDKKIVEKDSAVQKRLTVLAEAAARADFAAQNPNGQGGITMFVPAERDSVENISEHLTVHSFSGPRFIQLWKMWRKGKEILKHHPLSFSPSTEGERKDIYDLITVQDLYFLGGLGVRLAKKFHIPLEVQVHGLERFSGLRKYMAESVLQKADRIRVVSDRLKEILTKSYKLKANNLYVLPVYTQIEPPERQMKRKTVAYPFTFLTVGRLVPVKNIAMQIRALRELSKKIPHVRLQIVGDGPERDNLKLLTSNLQLDDEVVFEGEQKDVGRYYEEADAFLLTSDSEGWGLAVLEAAAYKLPIVMTDVGLAREVIKNEESGLIIKVGDEQELLRAMQEFVDDPKLRERLGEAAYKAFKALPSQELHIQKQVTAWQGLPSTL